MFKLFKKNVILQNEKHVKVLKNTKLHIAHVQWEKNYISKQVLVESYLVRIIF